MLKFFTNILGEDYSILVNETPQSKKKILLMGSILFVPVIMWMIQGYLLSATILNNGILLSILVGITCSLLIFLIERSIIMIPSNSKGIKWLRYCLGVVIALIGSIVLDEIVFHDDINNHMMRYQAEALRETSLTLDEEYNDLILLKSQEVDRLYDAWYTAAQEVKSEADGTGGSGVRGVSEITRTKMELTNQQKSVYEKSKTDLEDLAASYELKKQKIQVEFDSNFDSNSLLTRIKVLFDFIKTDSFMLFVYSLFTLLLFFMEFMVVIVKSNFPETSYEVRVKTLEQISKNRAEKKLQLELRTYNPLKETIEVQQAERLLRAS